MTADTPEEDAQNYHDDYWRCGRGDKCGQTAGWGTDHVGVGACKLHGGATPSGEDHGAFKHGLYSDVIREEDKETLSTIEDMSTAAKLESTLNVQVLKLHRAIEGMEDDQRTSFMDAFGDLVDGAAGRDGTIDKDQLRYLAQMLGQNDRAIREWMDLIRKTAKDLHKITDGETVTVEHDTGEGLDELADIADDLF